jgi:hypothetical protein
MVIVIFTKAPKIELSRELLGHMEGTYKNVFKVAASFELVKVPLLG